MLSFICLLLILLGHYFISYKKGISYPTNYIFIWISMYFVFKYFLTWLIDARLVGNVLLDDLDLAGFYILIFSGISLLVFYGMLYSGTSSIQRITLVPRVNFELLSYGLLFSVLLLILYNKGLNGLYNPYENRLLLIKGGMAYLFILYQFTWAVYIILLVKDKKYLRLFVFGIIYSVIAFLTARAASQLMFFVIILLTVSIVDRAKVLKYFFAIPLLGIPYVIITGIHRSMSRGGGANFDSVSEALIVVFEKGFIFETITRFLNRIDQLESLALLSNAFDRGQVDYSYGSSLWNILIQWIPRSLWNDKPRPFSSEMTLMFRPDVFYSDASNNFTGIGELLFNFGVPGILTGACLYGVCLAYATMIWRNGKGSYSHAILLIVIIYPYLISGILASFINDGPLQTLILNVVFMFLLFRVYINKDNVYKNVTNE
jgi:hypothetical protein